MRSNIGFELWHMWNRLWNFQWLNNRRAAGELYWSACFALKPCISLFFSAKEWIIGPVFRYMLKMKFWNWLKRNPDICGKNICFQLTNIVQAIHSGHSATSFSFMCQLVHVPLQCPEMDTGSSWQVARGAKGAVRGWTSKFGWYLVISLFGKANK